MHRSWGNAKQHKNMHKWSRRTIFGNACPWQQNKANFGRAKKTNREGNKHNRGRLRVAKCLHMNVWKAQAHTIVKNTQKKTKRANINWCTDRFYSENKQALTRATKSRKTSTITTKQVAVAKIMCARMQKHNNKQNITRNNCLRRGSDTRQTCKQQTHGKVRNWAPKSGKQCAKALQKIRQQRNYTCNDKNPSMQ